MFCLNLLKLNFTLIILDLSLLFAVSPLFLLFVFLNYFWNQKQAKVIEDTVDFKVGTYCGSSRRLKNHLDWEKEMEEYEVS